MAHLLRIEEEKKRFSHDVELFRLVGRGRFLRYGLMSLGLVCGILFLFPVILLQHLGMLGSYADYPSTVGLTLGAVLLTITGAFIVPLARSMEAEDRYLQDLPNRMALDLRMLLERRDLPNESKEQLYHLTVEAYRHQREARRRLVIFRMTVATSAQSLLIESLTTMLLSVIQPFIPILSIVIGCLLVAGYATAIFVIASFVFPFLIERVFQE